MESILGYDNWKTTPQGEPEPVCCCDECGQEMYEGDCIYTVSGEKYCESCMRDNFGEML